MASKKDQRHYNPRKDEHTGDCGDRHCPIKRGPPPKDHCVDGIDFNRMGDSDGAVRSVREEGRQVAQILDESPVNV